MVEALFAQQLALPTLGTIKEVALSMAGVLFVLPHVLQMQTGQRQIATCMVVPPFARNRALQTVEGRKDIAGRMEASLFAQKPAQLTLAPE